MKAIVRGAILLVLAGFFPPDLAQAGLAEEGARWWKHVVVLADDRMEGRETGTPGYDRASNYVVRTFQSLRLAPGTRDGYRQHVPFVSHRADNGASSILVRGSTGDALLRLGHDIFFQMACAQAESLEAGAVFVGYGLVAPELRYDDLAGLDLRGRIAVYLAGGPAEIPEPLRSHAQYVGERWGHFRDAGAVGWLAIPNLKNMDLPWERIVLNSSGTALVLADSMLDERRGQRFAATVNPDRTDALFEGTGHNVRDLLQMADSGRVLPHFPLNVRIRSKARYTTRYVASDNVVAIHPGTDPALRDQYVVLSAHLDHLGIVPQAGDSIMNGALDNAAGVATLLEVARLLNDSKIQPKRSIAFLALTGEEKGLLGSRNFAMRPPLPGPVIADLNIDMLLPIAPFDRITVFGLGESDLGDLASAVSTRHGLTAQPDPMPLRNRFIRSDQFNFVRAGIPALAFTSGGLPGSAVESLRAAWLHERYHAPGDDLKQPVDRVSLARFNRYFLDLALETANREPRPEWKADSYFRRFARRD